MEKDVSSEMELVEEGESGGSGGGLVIDPRGSGEDSTPWRMVGGAVREYWSSRRKKTGCVWEDGPMELRLPRNIPLLTREQMEMEQERGRKSSLVTEMDGEGVVVSGSEVRFGDGGDDDDDDCQVMTGSL